MPSSLECFLSQPSRLFVICKTPLLHTQCPLAKALMKGQDPRALSGWLCAGVTNPVCDGSGRAEIPEGCNYIKPHRPPAITITHIFDNDHNLSVATSANPRNTKHGSSRCNGAFCSFSPQRPGRPGSLRRASRTPVAVDIQTIRFFVKDEYKDVLAFRLMSAAHNVHCGRAKNGKLHRRGMH